MPNIEDVLNDKLTSAQRAAATDPSKEVLTIACAGSGKSRTLAYRIAWLLTRGGDPRGIVAFTFTEKAADTIKQRVADALVAVGLSPTVMGAMYIGTIHSFCQLVLRSMDARYRQFEVLDENRLKLHLISRYAGLGLHRLRSAHRAGYFDTVREVADAWKFMNDERVRVDEVAQHDAELGRVLLALQGRLERDEFIDFSLMIRKVVDALVDVNPGARRAVEGLRHLLVDEYQDVNPGQETLIRELHRISETLFVVGDDDQAIYGWRGADVRNILTFRQRYSNATEHRLVRNYRSTRAIVTSADAFAQAELGPTRYPKRPEAEDPPGTRDFRRLWFRTRAEEAEWVADRIQALLGTAYIEEEEGRTVRVRGLTRGDFAILMRSTRMAEQDESPRHAAFTRALNRRGIFYTLEAGGGVFERPQVAVLRDAFCLLRNGPPDRETARRFFDTAVRPAFRAADFDRFGQVLAEWGRLIHRPITGTRRRVYPQQLVHDLLAAFGIGEVDFDSATMRDIGVFSRIIQDVEAVYMSIDSAGRFHEILNFLENVAETGYDSSTDDVVRRPDVVTVSTVHRAKGLEFPVVFVVDVEAGRFPRRRDPYSGWLPAAVVEDAIQRGAYQGTPNEEARLFYTAITRAERYLYVTGCSQLPGGRRARRPSVFAQRLAHPELLVDPQGLPTGLTPHEQIPRIDEALMPTSYSDIRYYLRCPKDYQFRKSFGFSPPIVDLFGFGMTVHTAIGKLHEVFSSRAPTPDEAEDLTGRVFHLKHVPTSSDPVNRPGAYERARDKAVSISRDYVETYSLDFTQDRQIEVRFEIPARGAVISGVIDLLLKLGQHGEVLSASVIDFKAIEGSADPETDDRLDWTELALQVQLYAKAARDVLGENTRTGAVHLLKTNQRVEVPVTDEAVTGAIANLEWAVERIRDGDFPMRPHQEKCTACDFKALCPKRGQQFKTDIVPPPIHIPGGASQPARAFSQFEQRPRTERVRSG